MTRDEIIRMAREAGIVVTGEAVWRLCDLVAAAEREGCAKVCEHMWRSWLDSPEENEPNKPDAEDCYRAIRARG